jgi:hypothetical protein
MSTGLQPTRQQSDGNDFGGPPPSAPAVDAAFRRGRGGRTGRRGRRRLANHPAWPLVALLAGYPLWWVLGIADYMFVVLAIPMAVRLYRWHVHSTRRLRLPPGFLWWMLFLVCMLAGVATLSLSAPGTAVSPMGTRVASFAARSLSYFAATVVLLYAGNLTERELSRRRLAWLLGLVAVYTVGGGLGGVIKPHFQFTAPLAYVVPRRIQGFMQNQGMLHPALAQLQGVLGTVLGRPDAPFDYTDTWGNCLAILIPWLVVGWWSFGGRRQRWIAIVTVGLAIVPAIYSLDRGLWIGLVFSACYLAFRLAARGRFAVLGVVCGGLVLLGVVVLATPLQSLITQRLHHNQDNATRNSLSLIATRDALSSPIIGYGDTRHEQGSVESIAAGPTAKCPKCGYVSVGGNGQLWQLFICNGFVGAALYLAFFAYGIWRYWRDTTPYGMAGVLVLLLSFIFMVSYGAVGEPLCFMMLAYALLWRNDRYRRGLDPGEPGQPALTGRGIQATAERRALA